MLDFSWKNRFPGKGIDGVLTYLDSFNLGVSIGQEGRNWWVATGEKVLIKTDSKETAEAFLMGMALAYAALPAPVTESIREAFSS